MTVPICACDSFWTNKGHHPECPVFLEILRLRAEVEGLRKLVRQAFNEGVTSGMDEHRKFNGGKSWNQTKAFAALDAQRGGEAGG